MRIRIIDAFTDRAFAGNPAAVCLLDMDAWPEESWMRQVAAEMNLPMTAFAYPLPATADADWALRWFNAFVEESLRPRDPGHRPRAARGSRRPGDGSFQHQERRVDS